MLWAFVSSWCKIPPTFAFSIKDSLEIHSMIQSESKEEALQAIIFVDYDACGIFETIRL